MTDGLLTNSYKWHMRQIRRWRREDADRIARRLVRRCTDAEYKDITERAEDVPAKTYLDYLQTELDRVNGYPVQIVGQRDLCEQKSQDAVHARETYGDDSQAYTDAVVEADAAFAKLEDYLAIYHDDPSWFDWLDYNALVTSLRSGG